jgi:hypothetical protein
MDAGPFDDTGSVMLTAMDRSTLWLVARPEDSHPLIVTEGYPTSVSDLFRVTGIYRTGHEGWNSCYTDARSAVGLARLVEGGISSVEDLEAAENALHAVIWHDRIDVIVPGFKYRQGSLVSYARCEMPRSELAFQLFSPCQPYDQIFATEEVVLEQGVIRNSSLQDSPIIGIGFRDAVATYLQRSALQAAAISTIPLHMGVPAYFSDPLLAPFTGHRSFSGEFYKIIRRDWDEAIRVVPDVDFSVPLPPHRP